MASDAEAPVVAERAKDEITSIADQIARRSAGDRAALRRLYLTGSPAADGLVVGLLRRADVAEARYEKNGDFEHWRLIAHVAAVLSGTASLMAHAGNRRLGRALHEAGYSENRLMRLTAARGTALVDQVIRMARYLAQAGAVPVNLRTVFDLAGDDPDRAEDARLRIARDYYAADHASGRGDK